MDREIKGRVKLGPLRIAGPRHTLTEQKAWRYAVVKERPNFENVLWSVIGPGNVLTSKEPGARPLQEKVWPFHRS